MIDEALTSWATMVSPKGGFHQRPWASVSEWGLVAELSVVGRKKMAREEGGGER